MDASRVALLAAIMSAVAWGLKAVAIGLAGGLDRSPFESPLFGLGLVAIVAAFASLGVAATRERPLTFRIIGGAVGLLIGLALSMLASFVAAALIPESAGWVRKEAGLWLSALLALLVTALWQTRRPTARTVA